MAAPLPQGGACAGSRHLRERLDPSSDESLAQTGPVRATRAYEQKAVEGRE
jgi:hypothetical protein